MTNLTIFLQSKGLSKSECNVAELVSTGLSNQQTGERLFIAETTVKTHLKRVYQKLGINSRAKLMVLCLPYQEIKDFSEVDL